VTTTVAATGERADARLVAALRAGDEAAFAALVDRYGPAMLRLARTFCATDAVAQEVVQESWMAVVTGIHRFEGRSSVATWLFRIVANRGRTRGTRERRTVPFSAFERSEGDEAAVPADRFLGADSEWPDHWATPPRPWQRPADRLLGLEAREQLRAAMAQLPETQRLVVALRDVEGLETEEVAEALDITTGNARVLLHRGRSKLRAALAGYVEGD
jgi:RNA polymerase sigma-70 factor (ECF subfamily)